MESLKSKRPNLVRWAFAALPLPRVLSSLPLQLYLVGCTAALIYFCVTV